MKENLDKKNVIPISVFHFLLVKAIISEIIFVQFFFHKLYHLQFVYFKISFILVLTELLILQYFYTLRKYILWESIFAEFVFADDHPEKCFAEFIFWIEFFFRKSYSTYNKVLILVNFA